MKYTQHTLQRLENVLEECQYILRYERGTFQSGYCILEEKKVVVLNKFLDVEGRINTLLDLIPRLDVRFDALTLDSQKMYNIVMELSKKGEEAVDSAEAAILTDDADDKE